MQNHRAILESCEISKLCWQNLDASTHEPWYLFWTTELFLTNKTRLSCLEDHPTDHPTCFVLVWWIGLKLRIETQLGCWSGHHYLQSFWMQLCPKMNLLELTWIHCSKDRNALWDTLSDMLETFVWYCSAVVPFCVYKTINNLYHHLAAEVRTRLVGDCICLYWEWTTPNQTTPRFNPA